MVSKQVGRYIGTYLLLQTGMPFPLCIREHNIFTLEFIKIIIFIDIKPEYQNTYKCIPFSTYLA